MVTAGPTYEDIDPVRYLGNRSSGRMGFALAAEAQRRGARVTLVAGPTPLEPPARDVTLEHPDGSDALPGQSLLSILGDDSPHPGDGAWEETYFSHCFLEVTNYYPYRVLRGRRYKYVRNLAYQLDTPLPSDLFRSISWTAVRDDNIEMLGQRPREGFLHQDREALFDIQNDPSESKNLIGNAELADTVSEMRRKVMNFRNRTKAPWLEQSFQEGEPGAEPQ